MLRNKKNLIKIMMIIFVLAFVVVSYTVLQIEKQRKQIAQSMSICTSNIEFKEIMLTFYGGAKGFLFVYEIKNSAYHSHAYFIPWSNDPIEVFK